MSAFFICFRLFLWQYGSDWQTVSLVSIFRTCVYIFHLFQNILYTVWRRKFLALVQRTKFFLKWILSRDQRPHQPSAGAGRGASHWSRTHSRSSGAGQARFGSRGLSRARSEAAVEETRLLLEASVIEFGETQWDLLPSSYTVCRLISRTVESALLPEFRGLGLLLVWTFSEVNMSWNCSLSL